MEQMTAKQAAQAWGMSLRRVQDLCRMGRIPEAVRFGSHWMIPAGASRPVDGRCREARGTDRTATPMPRRSPMLSMTDLYHTPGCAGAVSEFLADNPQAQSLFDASIAYGRGEIDRVYDKAQYFLSKRTGVYAVADTTMLLCLCAIWRGDMELWNEAKRHIAEAPCRDERDREVLALVLAAADSSVFEYREYPEWFARGSFEILHPDMHPLAKVFYAKLLYMVAYGVATRQYEMEGVQGLSLMGMLPNALEPLITQAMVDRTVIPEIYLRLYCATAYHNCGKLEWAVEHVDRAIALALPDRLYGILATVWRPLDTLLEARLTLVDPQAAKTTKMLYREFSAGQTALRGMIRHRSVTANLTDRERNVTKLVAFGLTNRQVAEKLGVQESTVKTTVQKIMLKTGLTDRTDFVFII